MGPSAKAKLFAKWERILAAEGLEPLDTAKAQGKERDLRWRLRRLNPEERQQRQDYFTKAERYLDRLRMAYCIWALHTKGLGRREVAARLGLSEKVVRLVLEKVQSQAGLRPMALGGKAEA